MEHRITHVLFLVLAAVNALGTGAAFAYLVTAHLSPAAQTDMPRTAIMALIWCICSIAAFVLEENSWRARPAR